MHAYSILLTIAIARLLVALMLKWGELGGGSSA